MILKKRYIILKEKSIIIGICQKSLSPPNLKVVGLATSVNGWNEN